MINYSAQLGAILFGIETNGEYTLGMGLAQMTNGNIRMIAMMVRAEITAVDQAKLFRIVWAK